MLKATWQQRVDALGRGHYRRFDERTATMLGEAAALLLDRYSGDLRRLHEESRDRRDIERRLQELPSIGPTGVAIFCREVQGVWSDLSPYVDTLVLKGARRLELPQDADELAALVGRGDLPAFVSGLVRIALDAGLGDEVRQHA